MILFFPGIIHRITLPSMWHDRVLHLLYTTSVFFQEGIKHTHANTHTQPHGGNHTIQLDELTKNLPENWIK